MVNHDDDAELIRAARVREAASRALAEAEARRAAVTEAEAPNEEGGPKSPEPTRFGDWERRGIAVDF